jgi:hypothetical protein
MAGFKVGSSRDMDMAVDDAVVDHEEGARTDDEERHHTIKTTIKANESGPNSTHG